MNASANPIEQSFELAAGCCEDLNTADLMRGSMLALTIEAILDFAGARSGYFRMITCEVSSHDAYGTPHDLFIDFFRIIRDTLRDLLAEEWAPAMDDAWHTLLADIAAFAETA